MVVLVGLLREWADVVFGVDSWSDLNADMTRRSQSILAVFPRTPMKRIFNTIGILKFYWWGAGC
jgi:hypothetical protein